MNIGQKVYVNDSGKMRPGIITEIWPGNEYHSAGFRVDIHEGRWVNNAEFNEYDIGKSVIIAEKGRG